MTPRFFSSSLVYKDSKRLAPLNYVLNETQKSSVANFWSESYILTAY